jgi:DNA-binding response OmpR family regulator
MPRTRDVPQPREMPRGQDIQSPILADADLPEKTIQVGAIMLWPERYRVSAGARSVSLTPVQFRLLSRLASQPHRTFSAQELYEGEQGLGNIDVKKAIRQRIYTIRRRTGISERQLQTVFTEGYRLVE